MDKDAAWLAEYSRTIGGSRAAAVCGLGFDLGPRDVIEQLAGMAEPPDLSDNPDVKRGILLEGVCRQRLAEELDIHIEPHDQNEFLYSQKYPWAHTLPDGWIAGSMPPLTRELTALADDLTSENSIVLPTPIMEPTELKVPRPQTWRRMYMEGVPNYYQIQCLHAMAVLEKDVAHFAALDPVDMAILYVQVPRHEVCIRKIMANEERVYEAAQALKAGSDLLARQFEAEPVEPPKLAEPMVRVIDTDGMRECVGRFLQAKQLRDRANEFYKLRKAQMLERAEQEAGVDTQIFEVPGVARVYNKIVAGKRTFDDKAAVAADPELAKYYKTGNPYRWFRDYPVKGSR